MSMSVTNGQMIGHAVEVFVPLLRLSRPCHRRAGQDIAFTVPETLSSVLVFAVAHDVLTGAMRANPSLDHGIRVVDMDDFGLLMCDVECLARKSTVRTNSVKSFAGGD
jgi:hypothetical protein